MRVLGRVRNGAWTGHTGKRIRSIVNIASGFRSRAGDGLRGAASLQPADLVCFRLSNVDGTGSPRRAHLDAAETLFIVCSKTFTRRKHGKCARRAPLVLLQSLGDEHAVGRHFVRVDERAKSRSSDRYRHMFGFWYWWAGSFDGFCDRLVDHAGDRPENFQAMLSGFRAIDEHFRNAPPLQTSNAMRC